MLDETMIFAMQDDPRDVVEQPSDVELMQFLIFKSDDLLFGANVEYVVEIITNHVITDLPMVPNYVRGILNLRGQIIPVIDVRLRLGKPPLKESIIIVLNVNGTQIGILVDSVAQMISIPKEDILPAPANNTQKLISGLYSLQDGCTMMVLDCVLLVES
jgi:purine-binding chemotaxis protein CheW